MKKKEVLKKMVEMNSDILYELEYKEKYLQRKRLDGSQTKIDQLLGTLQAQIKEKKEYLKFLKSEL